MFTTFFNYKYKPSGWIVTNPPHYGGNRADSRSSGW